MEETLEELIGIKNKVKDLPKPQSEFDRKNRIMHSHGIKWYQVMIDNGFQKLGSGMQATVWSHANLPYVLKLFRSADLAYVNWTKVAMANKDNPHMPKFISSGIVRITQDMAAIRMEPLHEMKGQFLKVYKISNKLLTFNAPPSQSIEHVKYMPEYNKYGEYERFEKYVKDNPNWLAALDITWNFMNSTGHMNDFHPGNCMMRGADTIVITDPVS